MMKMMTRNNAINRNALSHNSPHARLALSEVMAHVEDNAFVHAHTMYANLGTPTYFKNRYQISKFQGK